MISCHSAIEWHYLRDLINADCEKHTSEKKESERVDQKVLLFVLTFAEILVFCFGDFTQYTRTESKLLLMSVKNEF